MGSGNAILDAIEAKKFGGELSDGLIRDVVEGYITGKVPDYQMASLLMAIFIQGMSYGETLALTRVMAESGETYSFPECVDKHSTGGVGDKVSLTVLPIVAACGAPVAKLSGRGLGSSGGTIDKLESIPGFSCNLSEEQFRNQVEEVGLAIMEAGDLAPADKEIYALRDTTGTVDSLPLLGSSIVSKKVATGAGHLLYDVKHGSGAFMKTIEEARQLAELLVRLSEDLGIDASALITDMHNPLGSAVGNALEVRESVRLLKNEPVPDDLVSEVNHVATHLLTQKGIPEAAAAVEHALSSGAAYEKFRAFVKAQGGDARPRSPPCLGRGKGSKVPAWRFRSPFRGVGHRQRSPRPRCRPQAKGRPNRPRLRHRSPRKARRPSPTGPTRSPPLRRTRSGAGSAPRTRGPGDLRGARRSSPCYPG